MKMTLLLLEDVDDLGKKGEIVETAPGYARNFLLPKKFAIIATKEALKRQKKLQEERAKKAIEDKKDSEILAKKIETLTLNIKVKVDPEGKMYGSVSHKDILDLLEKEDIKLEKRNIDLKHPIKKTGEFDILLKLKEGVTAVFKLNIESETEKLEKKVVEEIKQEAPVEEPEKTEEPKKSLEKEDEKPSE